MNKDELVAEAHRLGISLTSNGEKLRVEAPKGALTEEIRQALAEHKAEILSLLTPSPDTGALLTRLRNGLSWLWEQHQRWQSGDYTAADDAAFSRVWNGWWELDWRLRTEHGFTGCIYGPDWKCPEGFGCIGCMDGPSPCVVAQLELVGKSE